MIKKIALAAAIIGIIYYCLRETTPSPSIYLAQLQKSRAAKNQSFRQSPNSPLTTAQRAQFDSLKYYPGDGRYTVAAQVTRNERPDTVALPMSDNRTEKYLRWGRARFVVHDTAQQLTLYAKTAGNDSTLFVPFTDRTNGHETYGGGRYFDVALPKLNAAETTLDFNTAYNPYCAYNNDYSCPVPPAENRLTVAIPAGEKSFHD